MKKKKKKNKFTPEIPELWKICEKYGKKISKRENITQILILKMYDELKIFLKNRDKQ